MNFTLGSGHDGREEDKWYTSDNYGGILRVAIWVDLDENVMFDVRNAKKLRKM